MDKTAAEYKDHDVASVFLYVNEAHPGELYPCHRSFEQKLSHAQQMIEVYGLKRPILVDALDGAVHRHFGSMPNMTWIFDRGARAVYKSDWTDGASVANALAYFTSIAERSQAGENLTPFNVSRVDYRNRDRDAFFVNLARAGQAAVDQFEAAFGVKWATPSAEDHNPPAST